MYLLSYIPFCISLPVHAHHVNWQFLASWHQDKLILKLPWASRAYQRILKQLAVRHSHMQRLMLVLENESSLREACYHISKTSVLLNYYSH